MEDYKPNSNLSKQQKAETERNPRAQKIVSGTVITKKPSKAKKITSEFIQEDVGNIKNYVVFDVLIPSLKKMIFEGVTNAFGMLLGQNSAKRNTTSSSGISRISYGRYYDSPTYAQPRINHGTTFDFDNIILSSIGEANAVLTQMDDILEQYKIVTVADLYDLLGLVPPHTANNYGWTDLRTARADRVSEGYLLRLPRAVPVD
jgi:hypothetical protein